MTGPAVNVSRASRRRARIVSAATRWNARPRVTGPDLEPIHCPECGGIVPLADAEHARCPYCGHATDLPEDYRAAFRAEQDDAPTRERAEKLYRKLSRRPSAILRACAIVFSGWFWLGAGGVLMMGAMAISFATQFLYYVLLHTQPFEVAPHNITEPLLLGETVGLLVLGTVLGVYGRRKTLSTSELQAALAARPPSREGGPAECRVCGAPLSVPVDALGVRCTYCGSDNLVEVPREWLRTIVSTTTQVEKRAEDAARAMDEEHRRLRKSAWVRTGATLAGLGAYLGLIFSMLPSGGPARNTTRFSRQDGLDYAHDAASRMLFRRTTILYERAWHDYEPGPRAGQCAPVPVEKQECSGGQCTLHLFAALHRGDRLSLRSPTLPANTRIRFERHHLIGANWPNNPSEPFGPIEAEGTIGGAHAAALQARWSSFYELAVFVPERSRDDVTLCVEWH